MGLKKYGYVLACSTLLLVGCGGKEEAREEVEETEETVPVTVTEEVELPYVTPFTGENVANEISMRPIIATINNHPKARPQSGIGSADVIYEMLAEGDVTRLLGLFQSDIPDQIGPIRSARDYFIELAEGLDAFYIAHGYSPEAQTMLMNGVVDHINGMAYDGTIFKRSSNRVAPHNSYIAGENIELGAEKVNASLLYQKKVSYTFYEPEENVKMGLEATTVTINYGGSDSFNSTYTFNPETQSYSRESGSVETIDDLTNEPIALSNVLFFEMDHAIIDSEGRREIDITSGGTAYLFQNGMMREVSWENVDGMLKAVEVDGSDVKLVPGQTWIHFVPENPGIVSSVKFS